MTTYFDLAIKEISDYFPYEKTYQICTTDPRTQQPILARRFNSHLEARLALLYRREKLEAECRIYQDFNIIMGEKEDFAEPVYILYKVDPNLDPEDSFYLLDSKDRNYLELAIQWCSSSLSDYLEALESTQNYQGSLTGINSSLEARLYELSIHEIITRNQAKLEALQRTLKFFGLTLGSVLVYQEARVVILGYSYSIHSCYPLETSYLGFYWDRGIELNEGMTIQPVEIKITPENELCLKTSLRTVEVPENLISKFYKDSPFLNLLTYESSN